MPGTTRDTAAFCAMLPALISFHTLYSGHTHARTHAHTHTLPSGTQGKASGFMLLLFPYTHTTGAQAERYLSWWKLPLSSVPQLPIVTD